MNRMMRLAAVIAVLSGAWLCAGCSTTRPTTEWTTWWPSGEVADKWCCDPGFYGEKGPPPLTAYDKGKELGFRSDGTVVWRERK